MLSKIRYRISTVEYGLALIEQTGLCEEIDIESIMANVTRRFDLVSIPQAKGAILKPLDGTQAIVRRIEPTTFKQRFDAVKIDARINHFAPRQPGGIYENKPVLAFVIIYHETGTPSEM